MAKVLFSVCSNADPISNLRDGPMLHLCRYEKPDYVYLFLSGPFWDYHKKDNRYIECIDRLRKEDGYDGKLKVLPPVEQQVEKAYMFDSFYEIFWSCFQQIFEEHGRKTELIVNVTSGTPAMQAALATVAVNSIHKISLKYVPVDKSDVGRRENPEEFDVDLYWEENLDNDPKESENRIIDVPNTSFEGLIQKEILIELIDKYDYHAAREIASEINARGRNILPEEILLLIKLTDDRVNLKEDQYLSEYNELKEINERTHFISDEQRKVEKIIPYSGRNQIEKRTIYEYLLVLNLKYKRKELADLLRGMTPLLYRISLYALVNYTPIDNSRLEGYCIIRGNGRHDLARENMEQDDMGWELLQKLDDNCSPRRYNTTFLGSWQLIEFLKYFNDSDQINGRMRGDRDEIISLLVKLRDIEKTARSFVAHDIVAATDDMIYEKTNYHARDIMTFFKKVAKGLGFNVDKPEYWGSYNYTNKIIKNKLRL